MHSGEDRSCVVVSLDRKCLGGENVGDERKIPGRGTFDKGDLKEAAGGADDYGATSWVWYGRVCPTVRGGRSGGCSGTADGRRRWPAREGEREKQRCFQVGRHTTAIARERTWRRELEASLGAVEEAASGRQLRRGKIWANVHGGATTRAEPGPWTRVGWGAGLAGLRCGSEELAGEIQASDAAA